MKKWLKHLNSTPFGIKPTEAKWIAVSLGPAPQSRRRPRRARIADGLGDQRRFFKMINARSLGAVSSSSSAGSCSAMLQARSCAGSSRQSRRNLSILAASNLWSDVDGFLGSKEDSPSSREVNATSMSPDSMVKRPNLQGSSGLEPSGGIALPTCRIPRSPRITQCI